MKGFHGGNIYEAAKKTRKDPSEIIDFSASINPLAPPPGLEQNLLQKLPLAKSYPDISTSEIVNLLAETHNCSTHQIIVSNGSTEIIYLLPHALGIRSAIIVSPSFSEYENALSLARSSVVLAQAPEANGFQPDKDFLSFYLEQMRVDAVILSNPNSPAGVLLDPETLNRILFMSKSMGALVVLDEVFIDFYENNSFKNLINHHRNLLIIRSLTKFYGLAGFRLGYALAPPMIISALRKHQPPWSVNTLAQYAGIYCLKQNDFKEKTLKFIENERQRLTEKIEKMDGFSVLPSDTNFLLIKLSSELPPASHLQEFLLNRGLLIRDCSSFPGLGSHFFRICIRKPDENDQLVTYLHRYVSLI
ncbi:MAG: threonine-phosphate decarboxylase [Deltaproteobacteria bacterium]|nr:MAG: threonine-phosphate decarboxylase [Deltaproteobacteria bacterium]